MAVDDQLIEVVRVLIEQGADVGAQDNAGRTALHIATSGDRGSVDVVRMLLERGSNIGAKDNQGKTALQLASATRDNDIIRLLSEYGAKGVL